MPVQYEPKDIHSLPSASTSAGSMAFQESVVPEVRTLPWSVQVPGRPVRDVATPIAEWLVPQEETA
jgi:phage-related protein